MSLPDLSGIVQVLNALSSVAVIAGVVFQLRQNQKLIGLSNKQAEANLLQAKSGIAMGIVQQFTDDSFATRRKTMRGIVKKYAPNQWEGFEDTRDDFELRTFGSYYDFIAYFAREGVVELRTLQAVLGHRILVDWDAFYPTVEYYRTHGTKRKYVFESFEWLQRETRKFLEAKEKELSP